MTTQTAQLSMFDAEQGRFLKAWHLENHEQAAPSWLARAREAARRIAAVHGSVTIDDVLAEVGMPPDGVHRNVIGAVFAKSGMRRIGYTQTKRPEGHARAIAVWTLR